MKIEPTAFKSFCVRDRDRLGNRGWPIFLKIHTRRLHAELCECQSFSFIDRFSPEFWRSAPWWSCEVNFGTTFGQYSTTPSQSKKQFKNKNKNNYEKPLCRKRIFTVEERSSTNIRYVVNKYILLTEPGPRSWQCVEKRERADNLPFRSRASLVNKRFITRLEFCRLRFFLISGIYSNTPVCMCEFLPVQSFNTHYQGADSHHWS